MAGTLVIMGSGETTPTMVTPHKQILADTRARLGKDRLDAVLLDTPYGFQENAGEITAKAEQYFSHNVEQDVVGLDAARIADAPAATVERLLDRIRQADWVFAGPGSPTYAARQWLTAPIVDALAAVHERGGAVVFASAGAATAGTHAIPVYEIYKAGQPAGWAEGLGLMGRLTGWPCVVIPHFDNSEGGTHDTRFCYLGERRLSLMEQELSADAWVLGVDEHTACIIDSDTGQLRVTGRGGVHVRRQGQIVLDVASGETVAMTDLAAAGTGLASGPAGPPASDAASDDETSVAETPRPDGCAGPDGEHPLISQLRELKRRFDQALVNSDADAATAAALDTEQAIRDWSADSLMTDAIDTAVAQLRAMVTRLGALASEGMHDHTDLVRPHIETLLHVRDDARTRRAFEVADHIRGHMDADGVRVKDTREGVEWEWDEPDVD